MEIYAFREKTRLGLDFDAEERRRATHVLGFSDNLVVLINLISLINFMLQLID